jgi:hypothetical protein
MSRWRRNAAAVREAAQRGTWSASSESSHYRLYAWWCQQTGYQPVGRENLCHYGRVVVFRAPLRKLGQSLAPIGRKLLWPLVVAATALLGLMAVGVVCLIGWVWYALLLATGHPGRTVLQIGLGLLAVGWLVLGIVLACKELAPYTPGSDAYWGRRDGYYKQPRRSRWQTAGLWLTLPVLAALSLLLGVVRVLWWLCDPEPWKQLGRGLNWAPFAGTRRLGWLRLYQVILAVLATLCGLYSWELLVHALLVGLGVGIFYWLIIESAEWSYRADLRARQQREAAAQAHIQQLQGAEADCVLAAPHAKPSRPNFLRRLLRGAWELLVFIGVLIQVRKWRFCPFVDLPTQAEGELRNSGPVLES